MSPQQDAAKQQTLIRALLDPGNYPHPARNLEKIETHISFVLLAGDYAYKIKKAVNLGFLDFSTLEARRHFCDEELRLNRRLAPALYLEVLPITGTADKPVIGGAGPAIEYVLKMRRFGQDQLFSRLLQSGKLGKAHIDALAEKLAAFHSTAPVAGEEDEFGTAQAITAPALDNFSQLKSGTRDLPDPKLIDTIESWTRRQLEALQDRFGERKRAGFVRECHGDLHMNNVALIDGETTVFDCLEFDAALRWSDVMNEIAFVVMDLNDRARPDLARRFLNRYLEITGDYAGLDLLRFYVAYRAMVRAKVHWLRLNQMDAEEDGQRLQAQYCNYVAQAAQQMQPPQAALIITHGLSGSGKTTQTQLLLEAIDCARVRSDIERKRLHGLDALARSAAGVGEGIYAQDATAHTYAHLLNLASAITGAAYTAIVDAAFLKRAQRDLFRLAAAERALPFLIIDFPVEPEVLRERIEQRRKANTDASDATLEILQKQIETEEKLDPQETEACIAWNTSSAAGIREVLQRLETARAVP